jgi:hypothetical protein
MTDPLIQEIRRIKEANAAKYGFNIRAMVEDMRRREKLSGRKVVTIPPRRPPKVALSRSLSSGPTIFRTLG